MNTDFVTHFVARCLAVTSAYWWLRQLVEIQGYGNHAEAAKEGDQVLAGDGHKDPRISLRDVTNARSMAA